MARYLYSELSSLMQARANCLADFQRSGHNNGWFDRHSQAIDALVKEHMPSGSGFNNGTTIALSASHPEKLVFDTSFHHMNADGYYDGWTEHVVTVTPSFTGFHIRISGRNRNDIKELVDEQFRYALMIDVTPKVTDAQSN